MHWKWTGLETSETGVPELLGTWFELNFYTNMRILLRDNQLQSSEESLSNSDLTAHVDEAPNNWDKLRTSLQVGFSRNRNVLVSGQAPVWDQGMACTSLISHQDKGPVAGVDFCGGRRHHAWGRGLPKSQGQHCIPLLESRVANPFPDSRKGAELCSFMHVYWGVI